MSEYQDTARFGDVKRGIQAWRSDGELYVRLKEKSVNYSTASWETVVDNTVTYSLADDGETVEHDGDHWREYVARRFETLNGKRFKHE